MLVYKSGLSKNFAAGVAMRHLKLGAKALFGRVARRQDGREPRAGGEMLGLARRESESESS